jgi:PadR family transcriptional regulator PadR
MPSSIKILPPAPDYQSCPCTGRNLDKLMQPAILTALAESDAHGYVLIQRLAEMPPAQGQKPDAAGVYRFLRQMEERGLVTSTWDTSDAGPARRLYHLTTEGYACLARWAETLAQYRDDISALLESAQAALEHRTPDGAHLDTQEPDR